METNTFAPIPTCDIPMPILEGVPIRGSGESDIPRILLQAAGSGQAERRVAGIVALFLLLALGEFSLFLRLPPQDSLIVYGDFPRQTLIEGSR